MESELKPVPIEPQSRWSMPSPGFEQTTVAAPNKVLRNTYWLLALSMLPTIIGAYTGMAIDFAAFYKASPIMAPLLMFGAMIGALFVVAALRNSSWGLAPVLGFTLPRGDDQAASSHLQLVPDSAQSRDDLVRAAGLTRARQKHARAPSVSCRRPFFWGAALARRARGCDRAARWPRRARCAGTCSPRR